MNPQRFEPGQLWVDVVKVVRYWFIVHTTEDMFFCRMGPQFSISSSGPISLSEKICKAGKLKLVSREDDMYETIVGVHDAVWGARRA
jgi:hypothetical protein